MSSRRILYIQHAGALGGSCMSLLYLIEGLDRSHYEPIVACIHPTPEVIALYQKNNIEAFYWSGITPFEHTTLGWAPLYDPLAIYKMSKQLLCWRTSADATYKLVKQVKPDIVHLNSLVLAPSASGAKRSGKPVVWHVREPVHPGHLGIRKGLLSECFLQFADEGIFISEYDRQQLTAGRKGVVVHNFVDFHKFDPSIEGGETRRQLGLGTRDKVILFLGGRSPIKGIFPLLRAMPSVKQAIPNVHLLVASGAYHFSGRLLSHAARTVLPMLRYGTVAQRVDHLIDRHDMHDYVHMLEWRTDIPNLLAASDVLVFPSVEPHFARPIIEAGAMAKPVVASRIGGVEELVKEGETGLLVPPNNVMALTEALMDVLSTPEGAHRLGQNGLVQAHEKFSITINVEATTKIYQKIANTVLRKY